MPQSKIKSASKNSYTVNYRVVGDIKSLTSDQIEQLAIRYLRTAARGAVVSAINEAEPAALNHSNMLSKFVESGAMTMEFGKKFFEDQGWVTEVPTQYEIPVSALIPDDSGRGKKAANIFEFGGEDDADDNEVVEGEPKA